MKPGWVAAAIAAALFASSCSEDPQKAKLRFVASGDRLVAAKNYPDAIIQYRNAVANDGSWGEARLKLGGAYEAIGDFPNTLREYVRAADLMSGDIHAQLKAGQVLILAGQFPEAKARAVAILAIEPKNVGTKVARAYVEFNWRADTRRLRQLIDETRSHKLIAAR